MPKLNSEIILYNIQEAREQLQEIEKRLKGENLSETDFQNTVGTRLSPFEFCLEY